MPARYRPAGHGWQRAACRLRKQPETTHTTLIAITGYGKEQDRRAAFDAGFDHHLVKPVDFKELAAVLETIRSA
ncbi:response regulator [Pseudoduganella lutea]|uniref:Response regulator n=1 Tax=Pseudoduganella lutea TaxID=321985 RepID=A0A4P6KU59_9BURK|nr:response regulator [Pseudoduganella lutea]QBE62234.1 response regulator [Pseudoduganella lutea]